MAAPRLFFRRCPGSLSAIPSGWHPGTSFLSSPCLFVLTSEESVYPDGCFSFPRTRTLPFFSLFLLFQFQISNFQFLLLFYVFTLRQPRGCCGAPSPRLAPLALPVSRPAPFFFRTGSPRLLLP